MRRSTSIIRRIVLIIPFALRINGSYAAQEEAAVAGSTDKILGQKADQGKILEEKGQSKDRVFGDDLQLPTVEQSIPSHIRALQVPTFFDFDQGLKVAITASSDLAQKHTLQGLNHLHGGWEFEASRHFAAAMTEDPLCLMAHWGMVMALLSPSPETDSARIAAAERLLHLIEKGYGTELERGYAYGLVKYLSDGPLAAANAFQKVAERFPEETQAKIFAALFGRGGYDDAGGATPDQLSAEAILLELYQEDVANALPLHGLLLIRAEGPDLTPSLDLARSLVAMNPKYPPYQHLLGHYEWRSGNHKNAEVAFATAYSLFGKWMEQNGASIADCEGAVRSEAYRIVSLASIGNYEAAIAAAELLAKQKPDLERASAFGTRQLLWEAATLPTRIYLQRSLPGDSAKALDALPSPEANKPYLDLSLSYWWTDGLRIASEAHRLLDIDELSLADEAIEALSYHGEAMARKRKTAIAIGETSEWSRSFVALETLAAELRGRRAMLGPNGERGSAFNWFRAASDRQSPSTQLAPPALLSPMSTHLGDYFVSIGKIDRAIESYTEALEAFPNHSKTVEKLDQTKAMAH